jgi:hypothetical protein
MPANTGGSRISSTVVLLQAPRSAGVHIDVTPQPPAVRILSGLYVAGAAALLLLAGRTAEPPQVPPLEAMRSVTAGITGIEEQCSTSGTYAKTTWCYWFVSLDDGTDVGWPWPHEPGAGRKEVERYLRDAGPVTVHHWRGTAFQIAVRDGSVYVDYEGAASWERWQQWIRVGAGIGVAAAAVVRIAIEIRRLHRGEVAPDWDGAPALTLTCLLGAPFLLLDRPWWPVIALALVAAGLEPVDRRLSSLRGAGR